MIPAGIKDGEIEVFETNDGLFAMISGSKAEFSDIPLWALAVIDNSIDGKASQALDLIGLKDIMARRVQWAKCNIASYDFTADITPGSITVQSEYVDCGLRGGACIHEGNLCKHIDINGYRISLSELRIISCIRAGLQDKEICSRLNIAPDTLRSHKRNIQPKLGAVTKVHIATQSIKYGIS